MLIRGHNNKQLRSNHNGKLGDYIRSNVGVSQGSPIGAQLFIIYSDNVMNEYNNSFKIVIYRNNHTSSVAKKLKLIGRNINFATIH